MYYVAETGALVAEGVIESSQAQEIERRARATMVALVINTLLIDGIVAAALELVFWLAAAMSVAVLLAASLRLSVSRYCAGARICTGCLAMPQL